MGGILMTPTEAALQYFKKGWYSVPIARICLSCRHQHADHTCLYRYGKPNACPCRIQYQREEGMPTKGPTEEGWQNKRLSENAIITAFHISDNIGLLLGEQSAWLVDVDLDSSEAITLAPEFLPKTGMVSGRTGKPYSHYWYSAPETITKKFQYQAERGSATLLELRSTGGQTVVPPSAHPLGGNYFWHSEQEPLQIAFTTLQRAVSKLAIASLLAKYWPGPGARHDAALPIAGVFVHAGWPEEETAHLIYLAAKMAGHEMPHDRENVVRTTYRRHRNGQDTQGGIKLKQFFPDAVASRFIELVREVSEKKSSYSAIEKISSPPIQESQIWKPVVRTFSQIEKKPIPWLWYPYIPLGRVSMIEGDPGNGKSYLSLALSTCLSLGGWGFEMMGGESLCEPSHVLCIACEDDADSVSKTRLEKLQADQEKVHILEGKKQIGGQTMTSITLNDLSLITEAIQEYHVRLVFIDPIQAYLGEGTDINKSAHVRKFMEELKLLAHQQNCAIVIIRHLSKGQKDRSAYRGFGSIEFLAAARSVLFISEQPELRTEVLGGQKRIFAMVHAKTNMGVYGPSLQFEISPEGFFWLGTTTVTVDDLFLPPTERQQQQETIQGARSFLVSHLTGGKAETWEEIVKHAKKSRVKETDLVVARQLLRMTELNQDGETVYLLPPRFNN